AYFDNTDFRLKFLCMGLAAVNMLVFQFATSRDVARWDKGDAPLAGKVAGGLSLALWIGVVYFARKTGVTLVQGGAESLPAPSLACIRALTPVFDGQWRGSGEGACPQGRTR